MAALILWAFVSTPVDTAIRSLRGQKFECVDTVSVTYSTGRLEGIVRINGLFAIDEHRIGEIMELEHEAARRGDDQEQIARFTGQNRTRSRCRKLMGP